MILIIFVLDDLKPAMNEDKDLGFNILFRISGLLLLSLCSSFFICKGERPFALTNMKIYINMVTSY
jgi:hypothetical protein